MKRFGIVTLAGTGIAATLHLVLGIHLFPQLYFGLGFITALIAIPMLADEN